MATEWSKVFWFMAKRSRNGLALRERAREMGVRAPGYALGSATADIELADQVRDAGREIAELLVEADASSADQTSASDRADAESEREEDARREGEGSGRSESDPKVISLGI